MSSKRVVLQVITYRSPGAEAELDALFDSLARAVAPEGGWALVVIDNPSPLGNMREYLETKIRPRAGVDLPETVFVYSDVNDGFTGGHNRGWETSRQFSSEFVYLLNNDTFVDPEVLVNAVAYAQMHPHAAIVQSRVMLAQSPEVLNTCGNCLHYLGFGYADGYRQTPEQAAEHPRPHFYASGAGVLLRVEMIEAIGGLFYDTFMYHEDVDISWRARLAGYEIGYAEDSIVFHHYEFSRSVKKFYWMERNRHLTNLVYYRLPTLMLLAAPMLLMEAGTCVYALKSGWWKEKIRSWMYFTQPAVWLMIRERRKTVARLRRMGDRAMLEQMVGTIEAQEVQNPLIEHVINPALNDYFLLLKKIVRW